MQIKKVSWDGIMKVKGLSKQTLLLVFQCLQDDEYLEQEIALGNKDCTCNAWCVDQETRCCTVECNRKCNGRGAVVFGEKYYFEMQCRKGKCQVKVLYQNGLFTFLQYCNIVLQGQCEVSEAAAAGGECGRGFTPVCPASKEDGECGEGMEPACPLEHFLTDLTLQADSAGGSKSDKGVQVYFYAGSVSRRRRGASKEIDEENCQCVPDFLMSFYRLVMMGLGMAGDLGGFIRYYT